MKGTNVLQFNHETVAVMIEKYFNDDSIRLNKIRVVGLEFIPEVGVRVVVHELERKNPAPPEVVEARLRNHPELKDELVLEIEANPDDQN